MEYGILNNGIKIPLVGYGTYQVTDLEECERCVLDALSVGYRLIDTAQQYKNEEAVGSAIKKSGIPREEIFITTKINFKNYETEKCEASIEESLRKLQVDYIDLVLLHWPFNNVYAAYRVLEKYYEMGKIKAIGISNFNPDRMVDLILYNKIKPQVNQIETHLYCQRKEHAEWMKKYDVFHQAYSPLGQQRIKEMFSNEIVSNIAIKYNKTPAQIALKFLVSKGICIIPKTTHIERMKENIDLFDFELTEEEISLLETLDTGVALIGYPENPIRVESAINWK